MDGSRFDAWTRRRLGLAAGDAIAAALGLAAVEAAAAKRRRRRRQKRKRRCLKLNRPCRDGGKTRCCKGLTCDEGQIVVTGPSCCRDLQTACEAQDECCRSFTCQPAIGLAGNRCCAPRGLFCSDHGDCCATDSSIRCVNGACRITEF